MAGEWYRAESLRTLFTRHAKVSETGAEIGLDGVLVPDPSNPFDNRDVAVFVDGLHVGYMERSDAAKYHTAIARLPGGELAVPSRQWLRGTTQNTWARVTLSLPKPDHLCCPNPSTENADAVLLARGATIQVTREEDHMEHLAPLLSRYGSETVVAASLRAVTEQRPRSTVEVVAAKGFGMVKFAPYSRQELRKSRSEWVKRNAKVVIVVTTGATVLICIESVLLVRLVPDTAFKWYLLGAVHVGVVAAFVHLLHVAFLAHDRRALMHMRGAWGEENTRDELKRARRRRIIWGWVDSISLCAGDIDHLVVTAAVALSPSIRNGAISTPRKMSRPWLSPQRECGYVPKGSRRPFSPASEAPGTERGRIRSLSGRLSSCGARPKPRFLMEPPSTALSSSPVDVS